MPWKDEDNMSSNWQEAWQVIKEASKILIIQAENPDADSLGSSSALEEILEERGKETAMFCAVNIPEHLHYISGWDRVTDEFPDQFDLSITVDSSAQTLLSKTLTNQNISLLNKQPMIVFDHHAGVHDEESINQRFPHAIIINQPEYVATASLITDWAKSQNIEITKPAAESLIAATMSDSLGLTNENTSYHTLNLLAFLMEQTGAKISQVEAKRRELGKKTKVLLKYKGELLQRVEFGLEGRLAEVHIPWSEIEEYSHAYNPSVLVIDEMRLVKGVDVAVAFKTYPDSKITAKIRSNLPIANNIAATFGGGGHNFAAGFKIYDKDFNDIRRKFITATENEIEKYHKTTTAIEPC